MSLRATPILGPRFSIHRKLKLAKGRSATARWCQDADICREATGGSPNRSRRKAMGPEMSFISSVEPG